MCLHPHPVDPVPEHTARVANAAFPRGNRYLLMRDELGAVFEDETFTHLFPERGRPAFFPWRLALVTIMQFVEGLSDRQAADAVRARIDWKYSLSLELADPGFDASVLCEFRARLLEGGAGELLFDVLLERLRERGLVKGRGRQRTDSTHVLASVKDLNRLELAAEAMRRALNALAAAAPGWLLKHARPEWAERYASPLDDRRLPKGKDKRRATAEEMGLDGFALLDAVSGADALGWLGEIPAVQMLGRVWLQNYARTSSEVRWRRAKEEGFPPASKHIESLTDIECRRGRKDYPSGEDSVRWLGYKVHFTETCDEDLPRLITHVETATAPVPDRKAIGPVHEALSEKNLLPETHLVDMGYTDAKALVDSRKEYGVDLLGPMRQNYSWHAREGTGFGLENFEIDWDNQEAACPEGKKSIHWRSKLQRGGPIMSIAFSPRDCGDCPSRDLCVRRNKKPGTGRPYRELTVASKENYEALKLARERETTAEYEREYANRSGIEGTISRAVRACGLRRARYRSLGKVHLGHTLIAAAVDFARVGEWLSGMEKAAPRSSPFVELMEQVAA